MQTNSFAFPAAGVRGVYNQLARRLQDLLGASIPALLMRCGMAAVFLLSGRTKVEGLLTLKPATVILFRDEYRLPLLSPALAAHLAAYAEHLFPLLLVLGLATRLSAAALLGMTLVIQVFVYPDAWATHLSWAAPLLYLVAQGGGRFALDRKLGLA